jgi:hypothetical protein
MLRFELFKVKADLERELEDFPFNCSNAASRALGWWSRDHAGPLGEGGALAARRAGALAGQHERSGDRT